MTRKQKQNQSPMETPTKPTVPEPNQKKTTGSGDESPRTIFNKNSTSDKEPSIKVKLPDSEKPHFGLFETLFKGNPEGTKRTPKEAKTEAGFFREVFQAFNEGEIVSQNEKGESEIKINRQSVYNMWELCLGKILVKYKKIPLAPEWGFLACTGMLILPKILEMLPAMGKAVEKYEWYHSIIAWKERQKAKWDKWTSKDEPESKV